MHLSYNTEEKNRILRIAHIHMHVAKAITTAEYIRLTFTGKCVLNMFKVLKKEKIDRKDSLIN